MSDVAATPPAKPAPRPRVRVRPPRPTPPPDPAGVVSFETAGRFLELGPDRIKKLVQSGHIERYAPGKVTLASAVRGYVKFLKEAIARATKTSADQRVRDARATQIEQQVRKDNRDLIPREDSDAAMDVLTGVIRDEFRGLPARTTRDMTLRRQLEAQVDGSFTRIAQTLQKLAGFTREGGELPVSSGDDDAG